ncbi:hypothetical protein [Pararhodobacter sp.]|uniref:hypothetical protein n=1 Tax=Pararhodobacter sp. TaxID=2127056 RepID=UPI002B000455|nr:hypothetical protein [Pararhodobacter sp.]
MSDLLSPVSSVGAGSSAREVSVGGHAGSFAAHPKGAESAAAVRPVDPARDARDARMDRQRDLPVGPPPTFQINVLQDIRASQLDPTPVHDAETADVETPDDATKAGPGKDAGARSEADTYHTMYKNTDRNPGADATLDRKV